tara:strand:+ start:108 stop:446 length:339 start_codon:yes stop_codon:yes gene_type:complete
MGGPNTQITTFTVDDNQNYYLNIIEANGWGVAEDESLVITICPQGNDVTPIITLLGSELVSPTSYIIEELVTDQLYCIIATTNYDDSIAPYGDDIKVTITTEATYSITTTNG